MITHSQEVLKHAEHAFLMCNGSILDKGAVGRIDGYFGDHCMPCDHMNQPDCGGDGGGDHVRAWARRAGAPA